MNRFRNFILRLTGNEAGQDLVEYALVIAIIALFAATAMKTLAQSISTALTTMGSKITSAI